MPHRKAEYEASGHEVTLQQVREDTDPSAWIDGKAAYADHALDEVPISLDGLDQWDAIRRVVSFMVDNDVYFCKKCDTFYDYRNSCGTGFAGHQCAECDGAAKRCPESDDGHSDTCLNPRQKRNARVSTKYKCDHCGRTRQTTPTG